MNPNKKLWNALPNEQEKHGEDLDEHNLHDLMLTAILLWLVLLALLILFSLYALYDFFFVGTPIFRLITLVMVIGFIWIVRWLRST